MLMQTATARKKARKERRRAGEAQGRVPRARFDHMAGQLARAIRLSFEAGEIPTLLGMEGPLRTAVRADLCLAGWRWRDADAMACELMDDAHRRLRARRPTWEEGQRAFVQNEVTRDVECRNCGLPLMGKQVNFCCAQCRSTWWWRFNACET